MKLNQEEIRQIARALKTQERRYENSGKAVNADAMLATRSALKKIQGMVH